MLPILIRTFTKIPHFSSLARNNSSSALSLLWIISDLLKSLETCLCAEIAGRVESRTGLRGSASRRHSARRDASISNGRHAEGEDLLHNKRVQQKLFVDANFSEEEHDGSEEAGEENGNKEPNAVKSFLSDASPFSKEELTTKLVIFIRVLH